MTYQPVRVCYCRDDHTCARCALRGAGAKPRRVIAPAVGGAGPNRIQALRGRLRAVRQNYDKAEGAPARQGTLFGGGNCGDGAGGFKAGNKCGGKGKGKGNADGTAAVKAQPKPKAPDAPPAKEKVKATRAEMVPARRVGAGKDAAIVLHDGTPGPAHIKPAHVPPDWTDVKVSADPNADLLVTAKDNKGRAKTVYSDAFHMRTAAAKFARVREAIREDRVMRRQIQLGRLHPDPRVSEAAHAAWLIHEQATRPGSENDRGGKVKAYGATTLRHDHVVKGPDGVRLQFVGKEGVWHDHLVKDKRLARELLRRKAEGESGTRGGALFDTDERKLNKFVGRLDGGKFTAKDFRTLKATTMALGLVRRMGPCCATEKEYKAKVKAVAEAVSAKLGNRPAQALESYIDPTVFSAWRASHV